MDVITDLNSGNRDRVGSAVQRSDQIIRNRILTLVEGDRIKGAIDASPVESADLDTTAFCR